MNQTTIDELEARLKSQEQELYDIHERLMPRIDGTMRIQLEMAKMEPLDAQKHYAEVRNLAAQLPAQVATLKIAIARGRIDLYKLEMEKRMPDLQRLRVAEASLKEKAEQAEREYQLVKSEREGIKSTCFALQNQAIREESNLHSLQATYADSLAAMIH